MTQPPRADPEWITMRVQHQQECAAFARQVNTDRQAMLHRQEVERTNFHRCVETAQAELLARHSHQEGAHWTRHHQKQSKTFSPPAPPPPAPQRGPTPTSQMTPSRPGANPVIAPDRKLLPKTKPARKSSLHKAFDNQKQSSQIATVASAVHQPARRRSKQVSPSRRVQQQTKKSEAGAPQPTEPGRTKQNAATSRSKANSNRDVETIDLRSSDDDTLVELSTADHQKRVTPAVLPPPFRPAVPTATLQLFGESSQKQTKPKSPSTLIKQEKQESAQPTQGQAQPHLSQLSQTVVSKPSTGPLSASLHSTGRDHDTATFNALASVVSGGAATVIPPHGPTQPLPVAIGFMTSSSKALPRNSSASSNVLNRQVQHANKLIINRAFLPADKGPSTLRQSKEAARDIPKDSQVKTSESSLGDGLARRTSDGDVDIEDMPLAKIDVKAELKRLGATISRNDSMNADSPALEIAKCSTFKIDFHKTHLPSPSPSLASAPSTPTISETASLLNRFRKPTAPLQRQTSVLSQSSNTSTRSRKRKIDMSDDEQSDHAPPSPSCTTTARQKPTISLGSPLKKPLSPKDPPPPSASLISPAGKSMNGFGFRTKSTITSSSILATPPRLSMKQIKPTTPVTQPQSTSSARDPLSTPPSRRKAALRARSNVQKIMEAYEPFHAEDDIFCSSTRKPLRRDAKNTPELGRRLRSMSITPVSIGTRISPDKVADESVYSRERFLQDRAKGGDRLANRTKNIDKIIGEYSDEDYEDLETSEFFYVCDVILMKGQENRLTGV